jgi:hypothetical protein
MVCLPSDLHLDVSSVYVNKLGSVIVLSTKEPWETLVEGLKNEMVEQGSVVALPEENSENITMKSAFGLWRNRDIDEKDLRKRAWKQR